MEIIKLIIVCDNNLLCSLISEYFQNHGINILGVTENLNSLCEMLEQLNPDVILYYTPKNDLCSYFADVVNKTKPNLKLIIVSEKINFNYLKDELQSGIRGWVTCDCDPDKIASAINIVAAGGVTFCGMDVKTIFEKSLFSHNGILQKGQKTVIQEQTTNQLVSDIELTDREIEVLTYVAEGITNKDIAELMFISENTVKSHVRNILEKLQLKSRTQAALYARDKGIINCDQ